MVFSSIIFLFYFLPLALFLYYISPNKLKNTTLLFISLLFYAWGEPKYILLMLFSCLIDYIHSLVIDKYRGTIKAKLALISSIIINLSILFLFKYSDFAISIINGAFNTNIPLINLTLPLGISFFTFQTMSYTVDVYFKKAKAQKNILTLGTYITLFPQLVAGPIVRYSDVEEQLHKRSHTLDKMYAGIYHFIIGLCKKVLLANNLGFIWTNIKATPFSELATSTAWLGIICFTLQIYFDFSGYSDMSIGLGKIFGFQFLENFNFPYISKSITEFWRRWHISLSQWFRDYVYIPLGGNRCSSPKWIFNILTVWALTGLWHGASYNFILWGLYFAILLILEKLILSKIFKSAPSIIKHVYVLILVIISFVIFEFTDLIDIKNYLNAMFTFTNPVFDNVFYYYFIPNTITIVLAIISATPVVKNLLNKYIWFRLVLLVLGFTLSVAHLVDSTFNPFLYFRF